MRHGEYARDFVIKLVRHTANVDAVLKRFQNEAAIQAALAKHPNIVPLLKPE